MGNLNVVICAVKSHSSADGPADPGLGTTAPGTGGVARREVAGGVFESGRAGLFVEGQPQLGVGGVAPGGTRLFAAVHDDGPGLLGQVVGA